MKKLVYILITMSGVISNIGFAKADVDFVGPIPQALKTGPTTAELVTNVVNTLSFIAGVASVIAIIIGGIMYATSAGDEKRVQNAKNTILYAVVGIIIALLAWGISSFVVSSIT